MTDVSTQLELTAEEFLTLAPVLGYARLAWIDADPFAGMDVAATAAVRKATVRSLLARELLIPQGEAGDVAVATGVAELLVASQTPALAARAAVEGADGLMQRYWAVSSAVSVEHSRGRFGSHCLDRFPSGEFLARLFAFAGVSRRPAAGRPRLKLTQSQLDEIRDAVARGEAAKAVDDVVRSGAADVDGADSARAFLAAVAAQESIVTVTFVFRTEAESFGVQKIVWLDAGDLGLWFLDVADLDAVGEDTTFEIRMVEPDELARAIVALLPQA